MTENLPDKPAAKEDARPPFWVSPRGARVALVALHAAAFIAVLTELVFPIPRESHAVERPGVLDFPASYAIYGFVACVILVLLGLVLRRAVMRDEGYWRRGQ